MSGGAEARRLALFDLDGTLLRGPSSERRFTWHLARSGLIGPRQALAWFAFAGLEVARGRTPHAFKRNKGYLYKLEIQRVQRECASCVAQLVGAGAFDPLLLATLAAHRREGDATVLLSGTLQPLADAVAEHLGMDEAIGTLVRVQNGRYAFGTPLRHPFGAAKRELGRSLAAARGIASAHVTAYGDSIHDRTLLDWAGTAVAVEPDVALSRLAREAGWTVLAHAPPDVAGIEFTR